jgi:hypothetical protein
VLSADNSGIVFSSWEAAMSAAEEAEEQSRRAHLQELDAIRLGRGKVDDRHGAVRLVDDVEDLLQRVGSGTRIDDVNDEYRATYRALAAVLHRLGIAHTNPYRDLWRFYQSWEEKQLSTYASRRVYASELYEPVRLELDKLEWARLVEPIAGWPTSWAGIDSRIQELREAYSIARSPNDCKAIGLRVGALLQALGRHVFDPARHLPAGETEPSSDDAKRWIGLYVDTATRGRGDIYAEVRKLANATMRLAEAVKHAPEPSRIEAGIAADAGIQLANLVRRISELQRLGEDGGATA